MLMADLVSLYDLFSMSDQNSYIEVVLSCGY